MCLNTSVSGRLGERGLPLVIDKGIAVCSARRVMLSSLSRSLARTHARTRARALSLSLSDTAAYSVVVSLGT